MRVILAQPGRDRSLVVSDRGRLDDDLRAGNSGRNARARRCDLRVGPLRQPGVADRRAGVARRTPAGARAVPLRGSAREGRLHGRPLGEGGGRPGGGRGGRRRVYLAIALRNVGSGIAVLDRWDFFPQRALNDVPHRDPEEYRRLTRDLYVASGDRGFWQGAFRDIEDPMFNEAAAAIKERRPVTVDLLYGDHEGGQHTISRFALIPRGDGAWITAVSRHWNIERDDPR